MAQQQRTKQRLFILVSMAFFLGSMAISSIQFFSTATAKSDAAAVVVQPDDTLRAQERGYEVVLQREPDNATALEGLANTRLEMGNPDGAIAPLEQLVQQYPDRTEYKDLLAQAQEQAGSDSSQ